MVKTAIFAIGSELLEGSITDTNSAWLGSRLSKAGFSIEDVRLIPDNREKIVKILKEGLKQYDVILTTGGLDLLSMISRQRQWQKQQAGLQR